MTVNNITICSPISNNILYSLLVTFESSFGDSCFMVRNRDVDNIGIIIIIIISRTKDISDSEPLFRFAVYIYK